MRVAMYYSNRDVRVEEMPVPEIGPDEILVKVHASGVCGSDVMEWYRIKKAPLVLGHEIAGEIIEAGKGVERYRAGDRVFVSHHIPCNTCRYCLAGYHTACDTLRTTNFYPGGFSEYLRVPSLNVDRGVFILPDVISYEAGTFIEPLACVVRGQRMARLSPGQSVLVLGSGISGLLHISLAAALGAGKIFASDIHPYRLKMATRFGAHGVVDAGEDVPSALRQMNGRPADVAIVCTAAVSAFEQAVRSVDRGGTVLLFAPYETGVTLPLPGFDVYRDGITILPSYGASPRDIMTAIDLLTAGRVPVGDMITHRFSLEEASTAFGLVADAGESLKVIIKPHLHTANASEKK